MYTDGLFAINRWRRMADVRDGTSSTLAFGESKHYNYRGGGSAAYGKYTAEGGPIAWFCGGECKTPSCGLNTQELGRAYRSTECAINSLVYPLKQNLENSVPFGSFHSGGAHFTLADGHVAFVSETINFDVYQDLSTIDGGEIIAGGDY